MNASLTYTSIIVVSARRNLPVRHVNIKWYFPLFMELVFNQLFESICIGSPMRVAIQWCIVIALYSLYKTIYTQYLDFRCSLHTAYTFVLKNSYIYIHLFVFQVTVTSSLVRVSRVSLLAAPQARVTLHHYLIDPGVKVDQLKLVDRLDDTVPLAQCAPNISTILVLWLNISWHTVMNGNMSVAFVLRRSRGRITCKLEQKALNIEQICLIVSGLRYTGNNCTPRTNVHTGDTMI